MDSTPLIKKRYNRIAKYYDAMETLMETPQMKTWRKSIWNEATGEILEIGIGTGRNIEYHPANGSVTAIDFSQKMLELAEKRATSLRKNIKLRLMDVEHMEFADNTFDTVIATCVFCSVPNPIQGLQEIRRVCKSHAKIIMIEHVRSHHWLLGPAMDLFNPVMVRMIGDNINRDTLTNLKVAGIEIVKDIHLFWDILKEIHGTIEK